MFGRFKYYLNFFLNLKSLYPFIFDRLIIIVNNFLKLDPPYDFERKLVYDARTEKITAEIDQTLSAKLGQEYKKYGAKWDSVFQREEIGNYIAKLVNSIFPIDKNVIIASCADDLHNKGYSGIPEKNLSQVEIDEVLLYLETKKVFPAHVAHRSLRKPCFKETLNNGTNPFGSYDTQTILGSSVLAKLVGDEEIIHLVGNYFGCLPTLCNVNLYWSFVRPNSVSAGPQNYHRDVDDHKIVNIFTNLTDTFLDDGSYCHIDKTHNYQSILEIFDKKIGDALPGGLNPYGRTLNPEDLFVLPLKGYSFGRLYDHLFSRNIKQLFGPAGTMRWADGYGLHRAIPPQSQNRLLFWMTFSLNRTSTETSKVPHQKRANYSKVHKYIADNNVTRYVLRNVIDFRS